MHGAGQCTRVWVPGALAYRCRTCQLSPASAICPTCFVAGGHEEAGHDWNSYLSSSGGCCDCGDATAWRPAGARLHAGARTPPNAQGYRLPSGQSARGTHGDLIPSRRLMSIARALDRVSPRPGCCPAHSPRGGMAQLEALLPAAAARAVLAAVLRSALARYTQLVEGEPGTGGPWPRAVEAGYYRITRLAAHTCPNLTRVAHLASSHTDARAPAVAASESFADSPLHATHRAPGDVAHRLPSGGAGCGGAGGLAGSAGSVGAPADAYQPAAA